MRILSCLERRPRSDLRSPFLSWLVLVCALGLVETGRGAEGVPPFPDEGTTALEKASLDLAPALHTAFEAFLAGDRGRSEELFRRFLGSNPDDPMGWLLRMKIGWWGIVEGRDRDGELERRFEADFLQLRQTANERLRREPRDVRGLFALGEAYCTSGRLQATRGRSWSTLRQHQKGTELLQGALEEHPGLVEPLASLGVYHYYTARLPGFLRVLGRVMRVRSDRERGLQELRHVATRPGLLQAEAALFLLEVLSAEEDENLEALPLARKLHTRYPRNLGFTMKLADVLVGLERPDLAVRLVEDSRNATDDRVARVQYGYFLGRMYSQTGRPREAVVELEALLPESQTVTWLGPWLAYYKGLAYATLGRGDDARKEFESVARAPEVGDSRRLAKRELERSDLLVHEVLGHARAARWWGRGGGRRLLEAECSKRLPADREKRIELWYELGCAALLEEDFVLAARAFGEAVRSGPAESAWLGTRPRVRLLQALLFGGQLEEAHAWAGRFEPELGRWGTNRQLELLVGTCLRPGPWAPRFSIASANRDSVVRFGLQDTGFTRVSLVLMRSGDQDTVPMRLRQGWWEIEVPLSEGLLRYAFQLEGREHLVDPEAESNEWQDDRYWSLRRVAPSPRS